MLDEPLFTPVRMGDLSLPNRIVMAPLTRMRAGPIDHVPTTLQAEYYAQRASAGLIVAEATAISPDGHFALVAATSPVARRPEGDLWMGLYDTARKTPVWSRRDLAAGAGKGADALELSLSDDGQRALVRLSTGPVLLLGSDGKLLAKWVLEPVSRGEYDPGLVPRRTWLSADGTLIAFTTPVARSLPAARGWLYRVPR